MTLQLERNPTHNATSIVVGTTGKIILPKFRSLYCFFLLILGYWKMSPIVATGLNLNQCALKLRWLNNYPRYFSVFGWPESVNALSASRIFLNLFRPLWLKYSRVVILLALVTKRRPFPVYWQFQASEVAEACVLASSVLHDFKGTVANFPTPEDLLIIGIR